MFMFDTYSSLGKMGTAILKNAMEQSRDGRNSLPFTKFIACVRSESSEQALNKQLSEYGDNFKVYRGQNVKAVQDSSVVILAADPAHIESVLSEKGMADALAEKLLVSVAAGWTKQKLESAIYGSESTEENQKDRAWVIRTLPNIATVVSQGLIAIEVDDNSKPSIPDEYLQLTTTLFESVGKTVKIHPRLMNATTAVGGSTPAFFAIICDALIDASVAVGVPRESAQAMIYQSMQGTAAMMQGGMHPGVLRDQGTSPEGCTIGGVMVLEEGAVRGHVGRALREAVTVARLMETETHVNDTRRS